MKALAIYVHIPFCTVKCSYCDFNAYAGLDRLKPAYGQALAAEVESAAASLDGYEVASIAFGGGTPGEMPAATIASVLAAIRRSFPVQPRIEISLEANPGTVDGRALTELREAGVTRISFGAQSFDSSELAFLDRIHSPEATCASVVLARRAGFESVGLDLIYGLPGQSLAAWERNLRAAVGLYPDHVSTYALTVEDGTALALRVARGAVTPLDEDAVADMYESAAVVLASEGFRQYELSNWARPGHESRHNQVYWRDGDYLGTGAGAHGYIGGLRYENIAHPRSYISALSTGNAGGDWPARFRSYVPSLADSMTDFVSLRLRLVEGLPLEAFETKFGVPLADVAAAVVERCAAAGVLIHEHARLCLTAKGRLLHGEVAAEFLAHFQARRR